MIYIQKDTYLNIPHHFDCASAMYGAIDKGLDFKLVIFEDVENGKYDNLIRNNLFIGSVEFMNEVFKRIGLTNVRLNRNSNRESEVITLEKAFDIVKDGKAKIFIKPIDIKLFTGLVIDNMCYPDLEKLPKDTKVLKYEVFKEEIISEWRVYIHNNKIVDSRNYSGDFCIIPDYIYVEDVIKTLKDFPIAYTIDIGILESGMNVVIEYNDMWAIGNYGMDNSLYLRLLRDRYFEIIKYGK